MAKRGRPKKNANKVETKVKRKVGRPRKTAPVTKTISKINTQKVKRKRGRPRKNPEPVNLIKLNQNTEKSSKYSKKSSTGSKSNNVKVGHTRRKKNVLSESESNSDNVQDSLDSESDYIGINMSRESSPRILPGLTNIRKGTSRSRTTSSQLGLDSKLGSDDNTNKTLEEVIYRLKKIQDQQDTLQENMNVLSNILSKKTKFVQDQVNLIGLVSLASMHDMQLPIHQMGIISAFSDKCSEEKTRKYNNVLLKGLGEAITMVTTEENKKSPTDEFIRNTVKSKHN
jgi:hypothetical protein